MEPITVFLKLFINLNYTFVKQYLFKIYPKKNNIND